MTRRMAGTAALAALVLFGSACDDDDPARVDVPDLTRADVAGVYDMTILTFDPQGLGLPEADMLARLDPGTVPQLVVAANEDSLQLVFRRPGELVRTVAGSYRLGDTSIEVRFANSTEPGLILLPQTFDLNFDETEGELWYAAPVPVDTTRLFELVDEWSGEPVTNPLPGQLEVVFDRTTP